MMNPYLQVAIGGATGAVMRFAVTRLMPWHGPHFPVATLTVNVLGSLAMGVLAASLAHRFGNQFAPMLLTGLLGGFTTFSAFSLDALTLYERGQHLGAAIYVLASVTLSLVAVIAGLAAGRGLFA
ncbi:fluoride efflux transporter CrcB [Paracoccus sp. PARArs4]|uniref:fluoride efflux transporter CrcB n=1 Tax=Paracoccus sp. PARArs4 TaxID=2853442 RepID=UPI0024A6E6F8|nr:fluoride efflux transporter CrcB [Paracoccus sp. PARArs4]